jgi:hypothetical protein
MTLENVLSDARESLPGRNRQWVETLCDETRRRKLSSALNTKVHLAVLVLRGKIIAEAVNKVGSRSRGVGYSDRTIHAERNVVKQLGDIHKLRNADMYVMRFARENLNYAGSKPCKECECFLSKCMRKYGLKNVYYTL